MPAVRRHRRAQTHPDTSTQALRTIQMEGNLLADDRTDFSADEETLKFAENIVKNVERQALRNKNMREFIYSIDTQRPEIHITSLWLCLPSVAAAKGIVYFLHVHRGRTVSFERAT